VTYRQQRDSKIWRQVKDNRNTLVQTSPFSNILLLLQHRLPIQWPKTLRIIPRHKAHGITLTMISFRLIPVRRLIRDAVIQVSISTGVWYLSSLWHRYAKDVSAQPSIRYEQRNKTGESGMRSKQTGLVDWAWNLESHQVIFYQVY